jgi:hypothetical protein
MTLSPFLQPRLRLPSSPSSTFSPSDSFEASKALHCKAKKAKLARRKKRGLQVFCYFVAVFRFSLVSTLSLSLSLSFSLSLSIIKNKTKKMHSLPYQEGILRSHK